MLEHRNAQPTAPDRVVILGAGGFLGRTTVAKLTADGVPVLPFGSRDLDLADPGSAGRLAGHLRGSDSLIMFSALTPDKGRDINTFMRNLAMAQTVCRALEAAPVSHVVYLSSDAVYPFEAGLVSEKSCAAPDDLYGSMHRAREVMFRSTVKAPLAVLRSTLVYGLEDTHNSYGPNRFRRQAQKEGRITVGGNGEETRDYVAVEDVAALLALVLAHRSAGLLNLASGHSISAWDVAHIVARQFDRPIEVQATPRQAPVTLRTFDPTARLEAFPRFRFTPLEEGIARVHRAALERG